ncbi:PP2C family protein-serine/threonine phosphatase [Nocardioides sp. AN3]
MTRDWRDAATALFDGLLARTHLSRPSDVAGVVVEEAQASLDAAEVVVYWVNREQSALVPLAAPASPHRDPQPIDSTVAGRCFASSTILSVPGSTIGRIKMFVPVLDGTERVGVLELEVPADDDRVSDEVVLVLERFAHATAMALVAKMVYGDSLELVQRSRAMDLGAELLWSVVPPLTFATDGLVISAMLEPAYENGGDAFDYAVNEDLVHVAILDGVGHGLPAAGLSTFAIAAYRHSRRTGLDLPGTFKAIDAAIADNFPDNRFVTGLLGQLDPSTGLFRWVNAGHHPPLLLRNSRVVKVLDSEPATPFGVPMYDSQVDVAEEHLEPGDALVLYTDGAVEARRPDGTFLGLDGLVGFLEREAATKQTAPETLRRLQRTLLGAEGTILNDDATVLLLEWSRGSAERLLPQTVHERIRRSLPDR